MFAVVEIGGKQFTIRENDKIKIPLLKSKIGDSVKFDRVLLIKNNGDTLVGAPVIAKASVKATVLEHGKDKKITVFKKKRRNDYKVTKGHRQDFSLVQIDAITTPGGKKKKAEAAEEPKPEKKVKKTAKKTPEKPKAAAEKAAPAPEEPKKEETKASDAEQASKEEEK